MNLPNFFAELKRRNVYKVAVAYAVVAWLLIQAASILFPTFDAPAWVMKVVVVVIAIGFPIALIIAWAFEMTPQGMKRTEELSPNESIPQWSGRRFAALILGLATAAGVLLLFQFTRWNPAAKTPADKSIAVLPFASLSEDKSNAYFADGIQDEILTRLSKIAELKVISRTSTQQYQSKPGNIAEIGRQLGVAYLLEGSVQKSGDSARVNVQLIKAAGDAHVWAETYDRKLLDVFAVESEVAERIASSLAAKLTGLEKQAVAHVPTQNPEAYDAYLRGLAFDNAQDEDQVEEARKHFARAVELDPQFALAWAYLANREAWKYLADHRTMEQLNIARAAMEMANKLRPEASESHAAAGSFYYYCLKDFNRALAEFRKARELSPSSSNAIVLTAMVKRRQGELPASIQLQLEAAALDPRNPDIWVNLGRSYRGQQRFAEAREMFDRALALLPGDHAILEQKIETYLAEGDLTRAEQAFANVQPKFGTRLWRRHLEIFGLRREFERASAFIEERLEKEKEIDPEERFYAGLAIAFNQVALGQFEKARTVLEQARALLQERLKNGDAHVGLRHTLIDVAAILGDHAAVEREAEILLRENPNDLWALPNSEETVGRGYALLGDADLAMPHIERAVTMPSQGGLTPAYLRLDVAWDRIRNDPRFQKLSQP